MLSQDALYEIWSKQDVTEAAIKTCEEALADRSMNKSYRLAFEQELRRLKNKMIDLKIELAEV